MPWTKQDIHMATHYGKSLAEHTLKMLQDYNTDRDSHRRHKVQLCRTCHYLRSGMIAGQAFTDYTCRVCDNVFGYHNTNTPKICTTCANKLNLCVKCGGDINTWLKKENSDVT